MQSETPESIPNQSSAFDVRFIEKNEHQWPIQIDLSVVEKQVGRWTSTQRELEGFQLEVLDNSKPHAILELYRDERTDYRFNLSSQNPMLFVVLDSHDELSLKPIVVTASQAVAGSFMDGDYLVLSKPIPLPIQAWMEAFIGRHGELLEVRRKKRKGAGRSSGK